MYVFENNFMRIIWFKCLKYSLKQQGCSSFLNGASTSLEIYNLNV